MAQSNPLRIFHLASFLGNIGDNANHAGLYSKLRVFLPQGFEVVQREIRDYWRRARKWDIALVEEINTYDLCIIGGGNLFELWVEDSPSGTSIGFSPCQVNKITKPTIFHSLGCDAALGSTPATIAKFREFIRCLKTHPERFLISLRNDGSTKTFAAMVGSELSDGVLTCPDCGFFFSSTYAASHADKLIGINIAGDMLERRFGNIEKYSAFISSFAQLLQQVTYHTGAKLLFFCHIYKDLKIVNDLFQTFSEPMVRERVEVAPYRQGFEGAEAVFGEYHRCLLVLANRFHANVYSLANGIPVVPLVNYPQIELLYNEIGLTTPRIQLENHPIEGVSTMIENLLKGGLAKLREEQIQSCQGVKRKGEDYFVALKKWLFDTVLRAAQSRLLP